MLGLERMSGVAELWRAGHVAVRRQATTYVNSVHPRTKGKANVMEQ